ncbi:hypothetical protein FHS91_002724 [Sphingobium xanthum]|uniref:immunity protein Imm33 domain-containing protein n=1 Tax=Sphingobium xanthum TaxID=1387165 RepID=UPI001C8B8B8B
MTSISEYWDRWKRRRFGRYRVEDPRPIAATSPYTFFLPSENELLALAPGDRVKLTFVGEPGGKTYGAERMWVTITELFGSTLSGRLDNVPFELHQLRVGDGVRFERSQVLDIQWNEDRERAPPSAPPYREYWDHCFVDRGVLDGEMPVYYLYRETPDDQGDDKYPDSGWRFRGDWRGVTEEEFQAWEFDYIAIGKVLNADDSWVHLIDAPIGSAFIRNDKTNEFIRCEDNE